MAGGDRGALGNRTHGEALPRERRALARERPGWVAMGGQGSPARSVSRFGARVRRVRAGDRRAERLGGRASSDPGAFAFGGGACGSVDLAERIPGARHVHVPGEDWMPYAGDVDVLLGEVERFVRSVSAEEATFERVLTTVLFTDIVGSTEKAAAIGDGAWKTLVERHHAGVRAMIGRYRGNEVDTAGDGFFATFDGPARAVRCAQAIVEAVQPIGLDVRAGVHTGEVRGHRRQGRRDRGQHRRSGRRASADRRRCWSRRPYATSSPDPGWRSRTRGSTS